jgi:hypothetical protein
MHASRKELEAVYRRMRPAADLLDKPKDTNYYLAKQLADQLNADRVGVFRVPDDVWAKFHGALVAALKRKPTPNINLHGIEGFDLVQEVCAGAEPKALDQFIRCHIGLHLSELMHGTDRADVLVGLSKVAAAARTIQLEVLPMAKRMVVAHTQLSADAIRPTAPAEQDERDEMPAVAPVQADDGLPPVTTSELAAAFDGLNGGWTKEKWLARLGAASSKKWLLKARLTSGTQGGSEATWNPAIVAAELVKRSPGHKRYVLGRFQSRDALKPWLDQLYEQVPSITEPT